MKCLPKLDAFIGTPKAAGQDARANQSTCIET
jgi:hypothetical protein